MVEILVVHNDAAVCGQFQAALTGAGFDVQTVLDPMAALERLDVWRPDAIVTRIQFGDGKLNGLALGRMVRTRRPAIPVVFVCYRDWHELPEGVGQVLKMPLAPADLVDAVRSAVAPGSPPAHV